MEKAFIPLELGLSSMEAGGLPWFLLGIVGLLLFRVFDIKKPLYIKKLENLPGAWGILLDDLAAGLTAGLILAVILVL